MSSLISKITLCEYNTKDDTWDSISEEGKDLIKFMLEIDPDRRPTA